MLHGRDADAIGPPELGKRQGRAAGRGSRALMMMVWLTWEIYRTLAIAELTRERARRPRLHPDCHCGARLPALIRALQAFTVVSQIAPGETDRPTPLRAQTLKLNDFHGLLKAYHRSCSAGSATTAAAPI